MRLMLYAARYRLPLPLVSAAPFTSLLFLPDVDIFTRSLMRSPITPVFKFSSPNAVRNVALAGVANRAWQRVQA